MNLHLLLPFAQQANDASTAAVGAAAGGMMMMQFVFFIVFYVVIAFGQMKLAEKMGDESPIWAWIPILNIVQLIRMAGKEIWWVVLLFIPCVNLCVAIYVYYLIAEKRGKQPLLALLVLVPIANMALPYILAAD